MVNYRRARVPGACYFLTLVLQDRASDVLVRHQAELREALCQVQRQKPYRLPAIVVLPDHLHMLMALPADDADFSSRIRMLKAAFVTALRVQPGSSITLNDKGEASFWQRRFWEHLIRDEQDYAAHVDYIHINPLKHGLVTRVRDWPLSSFHRYVQRGTLPIDWAGGGEQAVSRAGE
jgi:putative transposase